MGMKYREQKFVCGMYLEVNMYPVYEVPHGGTRSKKRKPTREVQSKLNQINSERALLRLINANFTNRDIKFELTYTNDNHPQSIEQAKKDIVNFMRRIKRARSRKLLPEAKYIYSMEIGSRTNRIHFHVIMSGGLAINEIAKIWGKGYVDKVLPLMFDKTGCAGIARYFCKQQIKSKDNGNSNKSTAKRWVASHNCVKPKPRVNDYRLSKRKVRDLAEFYDDSAAFEKLYPDYYFSECVPFYNDDSGLWYLRIMMYRKDAKLDMG